MEAPLNQSTLSNSSKLSMNSKDSLQNSKTFQIKDLTSFNKYHQLRVTKPTQRVFPQIVQSLPVSEVNVEDGNENSIVIQSIQIKTKKGEGSGYIEGQDPLISKKWLDKKHKQLIDNAGVGTNSPYESHEDHFPQGTLIKVRLQGIRRENVRNQRR